MNDERSEEGIVRTALFSYMLTLVRFPFAQKCRHSVALDLLSLLEQCGIDLPDGLAKAICQSSAGDEEAERILLKILEPND